VIFNGCYHQRTRKEVTFWFTTAKSFSYYSGLLFLFLESGTMFNDKFYPLKIIISGDFYFHRVLADLPSFFSDITLTEKGSICLWCDATRLNMFDFHLHEGVRQSNESRTSATYLHSTFSLVCFTVEFELWNGY
jgi:hypothetical protein